MKVQKLKILLIIICCNISVIFAQKQIDSVKIKKDQVKNIYVGLKQYEAYREYYSECLQTSNELNQIINNQDTELKKSIDKIIVLNSDNEAVNKKILEKEVEIQRLKNKKIPWYRHPVLYGIIGFAGGVWITK